MKKIGLQSKLKSRGSRLTFIENTLAAKPNETFV